MFCHHCSMRYTFPEWGWRWRQHPQKGWTPGFMPHMRIDWKNWVGMSKSPWRTGRLHLLYVCSSLFDPKGMDTAWRESNGRPLIVVQSTENSQRWLPGLYYFYFDQTLLFEDHFTLNRKLPEAGNLCIWSMKFIAKCTPIDFLRKPLHWEDQGEQEGEDSDSSSHRARLSGTPHLSQEGNAPLVNGDSTRSTEWLVQLGAPCPLDALPKLPMGFCFLNVIQNEQGWQWNVPGRWGRAPFCWLWGCRETKASRNQALMGRRSAGCSVQESNSHGTFVDGCQCQPQPRRRKPSASQRISHATSLPRRELESLFQKVTLSLYFSSSLSLAGAWKGNNSNCQSCGVRTALSWPHSPCQRKCWITLRFLHVHFPAHLTKLYSMSCGRNPHQRAM